MKREVIVFFVGVICLISILSFSFAALYQTQNQGDFDKGNYTRTFYNSSYVQLNQTYNNGTYTSNVFDAGYWAQWINISWVNGTTDDNILTNLSVQIRTSEDNISWGDFFGPGNSSTKYYTNNTLENLNVEGRYFQYKFYFNTSDTDVTPLLYNVGISAENLSSNMNVSLTTPGNGTLYTNTNNVTFIYTINSNLTISACNLFLNSSLENTKNNIDEGIHTHSKTAMSNGTYTWSVNCTNVADVTNRTDNFSFTVNYAPEEEEEESGGSSGDTTGTDTYIRSTDTGDSNLSANESSNSTNATDQSIPTFETQGGDQGFLSGFLTGFATYASDLGDFTVGNLVPIIMLVLMITFIGTKVLSGKKFDFNFGIKRRAKLKKGKQEGITEVFK